MGLKICSPNLLWPARGDAPTRVRRDVIPVAEAYPTLAGMEALKIAACLCFASGEIIFVTRAARAQIEMEQWIAAACGKLVAASPISAQALASAIKLAAGTPAMAPSTLLLLQHSGQAGMIRTEAAPMPLDPARGDESIVLVTVASRVTASFADLLRSGGLTEAESSVVELAAEGMTSAAIARRRAVSLPTVQSQLAAAYDKLRVRNRIELVRLLYGAS